MIILNLDQEHEFQEDEVITLHIKSIKSFKEALNPLNLELRSEKANNEIIILNSTELGPPVPVEGKIADLGKVNTELTKFVKSITDIEQVIGTNCPLCGGGPDHKEGCLYVKAEQLLSNLAFQGVFKQDTRRKWGGC